MGTPNKQLKTGAELESLLEQLEDPFDPSEIKWRVTHTTRDGSRGAVVAFADQRAYTDRLNRVFTPSGWTRTYDLTEPDQEGKGDSDRQGPGHLRIDDRRSGHPHRMRRRVGRRGERTDQRRSAGIQAGLKLFRVRALSL
jgi:hypothetical protein